MPNRLAEGMNRVLKDKQVIKVDPEASSTKFGKWKKGHGNRKSKGKE
jgi:hypothetical protein